MTQRLVLAGLRSTAPSPARRRVATRQSRLDYDRRRRLNERTSETLAYMALIRTDPCAWCGQRQPGRMADADHIQPLLRGGQDRWENMTASCASCNRGRKAQSLLYTLQRTHARDR